MCDALTETRVEHHVMYYVMYKHYVMYYVCAYSHTEAQSMQTQRALAYLVENILLLFGSRWDEDRSRK